MAAGPLGYLALAVAVAGAVLIALSYPLRQLEFARFDTRSGRPGLDVGAGGGDRARFRAFVSAVQRQIRRQ